MYPEDSLLRWKDAAIGPCPKPNEPNPHSPNLFL
jgi:hypothetical protein